MGGERNYDRWIQSLDFLYLLTDDSSLKLMIGLPKMRFNGRLWNNGSSKWYTFWRNRRPHLEKYQKGCVKSIHTGFIGFWIWTPHRMISLLTLSVIMSEDPLISRSATNSLMRRLSCDATTTARIWHRVRAVSSREYYDATRSLPELEKLLGIPVENLPFQQFSGGRFFFPLTTDGRLLGRMAIKKAENRWTHAEKKKRPKSYPKHTQSS